MSHNEPKLCYIEGCWAYFTTQELWKQWGDDWDDAPYEHNAGEPYTWGKNDQAKLIEPWTITKVAFHGPFHLPCDIQGKSYSVQAINRGDVPWLNLDGVMAQRIIVGSATVYAGATFPEFCATVKNCGGAVYVEFQKEGSVNTNEQIENLIVKMAESLLRIEKRLESSPSTDQTVRLRKLEAGMSVWPEVIRALDKKAEEHEGRILAMERFFARLDSLLPIIELVPGQARYGQASIPV